MQKLARLGREYIVPFTKFIICLQKKPFQKRYDPDYNRSDLKNSFMNLTYPNKNQDFRVANSIFSLRHSDHGELCWAGAPL